MIVTTNIIKGGGAKIRVGDGVDEGKGGEV